MRGGKFRSRLVALGAAASAATLVLVASPAAADPNILTLTGGATTTKSTKELGTSLLTNGILPLPVGGAKVKGIDVFNLSLTTELKVKGGTLDQSKFLAGDVQHSGGLKFVNLFKFRSVTVSDFVVDTAGHDLTATVNGGQQVALFTLDLSGLQLGGDGTTKLELNNVGLSLTQEGADTLNGKLRTKAFKPGLKFGTGNTAVTFTRGS